MVKSNQRNPSRQYITYLIKEKEYCNKTQIQQIITQAVKRNEWTSQGRCCRSLRKDSISQITANDFYRKRKSKILCARCTRRWPLLDVCVCWLLAVQLLLTLFSSAGSLLWATRSLVIAAEWNGEQMRHTTHSVRARDKKSFLRLPFNRPPATFCPLGVTSREKSLAKAIPQQTWKVSPATDPHSAYAVCDVLRSFLALHFPTATLTQTLHWSTT